MPVVLEVERGQSESAFDVNLASYVYVEQALQATRSISGRTAYQQEVTRLTGWTFDNRGDSYANPPNEPPLPVRWGGTSFVDDWILPPADLTPLASNTDPRLAGLRGEAYFTSLDAILNCQTFSMTLSSGHFGGNGSRVRLSGTARSPERCHPA